MTLTESSTTPCLLTATFDWGPRGNKYVGKNDLATVVITKGAGAVPQTRDEVNVSSGQADSLSVQYQATPAGGAQQWNAFAALVGGKGKGGDSQVNEGSGPRMFNCQ